MMTLTDAAAGQLAELLNDDNVDDSQCVRLVAKEGELALGLDEAKEEDTTFEHDGQTVLCLDQQIAELLEEKTLDVDESSNLLIR